MFHARPPDARSGRFRLFPHDRSTGELHPEQKSKLSRRVRWSPRRGIDPLLTLKRVLLLGATELLLPLGLRFAIVRVLARRTSTFPANRSCATRARASSTSPSRICSAADGIGNSLVFSRSTFDPFSLATCDNTPTRRLAWYRRRTVRRGADCPDDERPFVRPASCYPVAYPGRFPRKSACHNWP